MRNLIATLAAVLVLVLVFSVSCKKESPGPPPEPTPGVAPTAIPPTPPDMNAPACYVKVPVGTPPVCKNASGDRVPCPTDMSGLPECGD